ncbi:MAG: hypothetical protein E6K18_00085 [Methanobacteriota archaeon]|nr:MAG: hypothetical protein E6K18_00085 [Euryarchaeota archaeon]
MISKLWGVLLSVTGGLLIRIVFAIGWTCPTGGTTYCSHAYIAGIWAFWGFVGFCLFVTGIVVIVVGGSAFPRMLTASE